MIQIDTDTDTDTAVYTAVYNVYLTHLRFLAHKKTPKHTSEAGLQVYVASMLIRDVGS